MPSTKKIPRITVDEIIHKFKLFPSENLTSKTSKTLVSKINNFLNKHKIRLRLKILSRNSCLGLQGTFPLKPGDTFHRRSKQYTLTYGLHARTRKGIALACNKLLEVEQDLRDDQFDWLDYLQHSKFTGSGKNLNPQPELLEQDQRKLEIIEYIKACSGQDFQDFYLFYSSYRFSKNLNIELCDSASK